MRLINADELKNVILDLDLSNISLSNCLVAKAIDNAPTVEQECYITGAQWDEFMKERRRPQGEWITKEHSIEYYCSLCGERLDQCCENFCCHCGADMRKEVEGDKQ